MPVLIIAFKLTALDDAVYRQHAQILAPQFLQVPGLVSKTWLADEASNTCGCAYFFEDAASVQEYLESVIVTGLQANPAIAELSIRTCGAVEATTLITASPLVEAWVPAKSGDVFDARIPSGWGPAIGDAAGGTRAIRLAALQ